MRKKYKIEQPLLKMYGDSPEGAALRTKVREREIRRERIEYKIKDFLSFSAYALLAVAAISIVLAAIIVPAQYYTETYTEIITDNISAEDYAYILQGNESMRISYHHETRTLNSSIIVIEMAITHTWDGKGVTERFLEIGNVSHR